MPYVRRKPDERRMLKRPPLDALPDSLAEKLTRFDELTDQLRQTQVEATELDNPRQEDDAERKTRAAHLEAVKTGDSSHITDFVAELHKRRETLKYTIAALNDAINEVFYQIYDQRQELVNDPALARQIETASKALTASITKARALVTPLAELLALQAWYDLNEYDPTVWVNPGHLVPTLPSLTGVKNDTHQPLRLDTVLHSLDTITSRRTER